MAELWRNDVFFARLAARVGWSAPTRNQDELDANAPPLPFGARPPQPQTFPGNRDDDTRQLLPFEHDAPQQRHADYFHNFHEFNEAPPPGRGEDDADRRPDSYGSPAELNAFEGQSGIHLGSPIALAATDAYNDGHPDVAWQLLAPLPRDQAHALFETIRRGQRLPWLACDLDGTLLSYESGAAAMDETRPGPDGGVDFPPLGVPLPGAADALRELVRLGWRISIYTARFGDPAMGQPEVARHADEIARHLNQYAIPFSDIWVGRKPRADYFVDDKAIAFDGDWPAILEQLTLEDSPPRNEKTRGAQRDGEVGLWRYAPGSGAWKLERMCDDRAKAREWLAMITRDEPDGAFRISVNRPRGVPAPRRQATLRIGEMDLTAAGRKKKDEMPVPEGLVSTYARDYRTAKQYISEIEQVLAMGRAAFSAMRDALTRQPNWPRAAKDIAIPVFNAAQALLKTVDMTVSTSSLAKLPVTFPESRQAFTDLIAKRDELAQQKQTLGRLTVGDTTQLQEILATVLDANEHEAGAGRGPLNYAEDPNDFGDQTGLRDGRGVTTPAANEWVVA